MTETLEHRFWYPKDKLYLYIAADSMPNASTDDFLKKAGETDEDSDPRT